MRGEVKHAGRNGKHFYIYLGAQVVMEYLKLAYGQTRSEQTVKFKGTKTEAGLRQAHKNFILITSFRGKMAIGSAKMLPFIFLFCLL